LDFRVAELLAKHGLTGTFYVPKTARRGTIEPSEIRELAGAFEVGAHTMHHVDLSTVDDDSARREILESRAWLEDITGKPCAMFCFPRGKFRRQHLPFVEEAGYTAARTVELLSLAPPARQNGTLLMPTTVQVYPHAFGRTARNLVRRVAYRQLWTLLSTSRAPDWGHLSETLCARAARDGGVFHLWGHSWEVEKFQQWNQLDEALALMSRYKDAVRVLTNSEVCEHSRPV
jgi:peptidoglycan/xylan/chitin deacetylase (PgdA/CDA1 family)